VDKFVLVEATLTFKGNPKPLYYAENKDRFQKFADKIVHVVVDKLVPNATYVVGNERCDSVWMNEYYQRYCIQRGILQLSLEHNDLILLSDLDEIPNMSTIFYIIRSAPDSRQIAFALEQDMYYYNLTSKTRELWYPAKIVSYLYYLAECSSNPQLCRIKSLHHIPNGGWHLSYFGDPAFIRNKLLNFSHQEYNTDKYTNIQTIEEKVKTKKNLFVDADFINIPITENQNLPPLYADFFDSNGEIISSD
jgi:beta-1,4-mannosyl-glycoprotein beta-1,4-N-acetylglucosaminyltransferase